jgi:hypothetical protein
MEVKLELLKNSLNKFGEKQRSEHFILETEKFIKDHCFSGCTGMGL